MKKVRQRTALARVVKKYARLGLGSSGTDAFTVCQRIRGSSRTLSEANDLFAVWELIRYLKLSGHTKELYVLEKIYLDKNVLKRNFVSMRVQSCADTLHCDARTLYRHLSHIETCYETIRSSLS